MRGNTPSKILGLLALVLFAALPMVAQQQSQSQTGDPIADAARKAREEKKNAPKPKKVFTDDDIAPKPQTPPAGAQQAPAAGEAGQGAGAEGAAGAQGAAAKQPNSEEVWRKRFAAQRARIAKAEEELDVLQREMDKSQVQYYPDPQKALNEQLTRKDINTKTAKIDQKKQQIEQLKQELSNMEDELRKSGGDPGWARE
jgi:hypothetical protein